MTIDTLPRPSRPGPLLALDYWLEPERLFGRCEGLGDRFVIDLPGLPPWVCTTSPEDVKTIFTAQQGSLSLGRAVRRIAPHEALLGPETIISKDGPEHVRERRRAAPPFHGDRLKAYEAVTVAAVRRHLDTWPVGQEARFAERFNVLTLDVIIEIVFGVTDAERQQRLRDAVVELDAASGGLRFLGGMIVGLALRGTWPPYPRLDRAVGAVKAIVHEEIAERRRSAERDREDFLSTYLAATDADTSMSDDAIANLVLGLLLGGHETTTMTLSWVLERLSREPAALAWLEDGLAAGDDAYLDAVIAETLRLRPPAPLTARYVVEAFQLGDLRVPQGVLVVPFITMLHRRADIYPDPLAFRPERFLRERPGTYTWIPFGGGAHRCLGGAFALMEIRVILRTLFERHVLEATDRPAEGLGRRHFGLAPRDGARATLTVRQTREAACAA